jgi:hypothetical protein
MKVEPKELAAPLVLGNGGQALIQQKFQTIMVSFNYEGSPLKVWALVAHNVDEPDQFPLVRGQLGVAAGDWSAEVRHEARALVEHCAKAHSRRVALDGERLVEVRQLQDRGRCQGPLELVKHVLSVGAPNEAALTEKLCQWRRDGAVVADEPAIVAGQPQECAYCAHRGRHQPVEDYLNLELVHGDTRGRYHMAQIGYLRAAKGALGTLHEQLVLL